MNEIRAACHVHSDWSYDGKWTLEKIADVFARRGYNAVLTSEHDRGFDEARRIAHRTACAKASNDRILIIPGIEYSDPSNTVHLLVWGDVPFVGCDTEPEEVLDAVEKANGIVVFAHPSRKEAWKHFKPEWNRQLLGIEFWNRKADGWAPSKDALRLLDGCTGIPFLGLDFHDRRQLFPLVTMIETSCPVTEKSVITAMRGRRCRSTAFGFAATAFARPGLARTLHSIEAVRRQASAVVRKFVTS